MRDFRLSRWLVTAILAVVTAVGLPGCSGSKKGNDANDLVVGFIYIGSKEDYGYSQAHAQGAAAVKKLPGVKVVEAERIPEDDNALQAMDNMIDVEGAKVIFASSFNYYDPFVLKAAEKHPDITFLHCGGPWPTKDGKKPKNVSTYFGYIDECQYLSGIVAGMSTKTNKLGFVAAIPIPQVRRNINAFLLGARSVNKDAKVYVSFTGDWSKPTEEANAAKVLLDLGCDVFTCHVDGPRVVVETAEKAGKMTCGYHASQAALAPKGYLTGAEWNWEKVYVDYVTKFQKKESFPNYIRGGLKDGIVRMSPYGPLVSEEAKKKADATKAKFMDGSFVIFKGPLMSNDGKEVIEKGVEYAQNDPKLEAMNYLVEGVVSADK